MSTLGAVNARTVQMRIGVELSVETNIAAKAASLLSRGAATDRSHGRKAVVGVSFRTEPRRGERFARNLSPLRGSSSYWPTNPGLAPGAKIYSRSAASIGCASRDILDNCGL
jgi:hypothetical protein